MPSGRELEESSSSPPQESQMVVDRTYLPKACDFSKNQTSHLPCSQEWLLQKPKMASHFYVTVDGNRKKTTLRTEKIT